MNKRTNLMRTHLVVWALFVTALGFNSVVRAESPSPDYTIRLVSGDVATSEDTQVLHDLSADVQRGSAPHFLVQLFEVPDDQQKSTLENAGIHLLEPVTGNAWVASLTKSITPAHARALGVRWAGELKPTDKMNPRVQQQEFGEWARYEDGKVIVSVRFHKDVDKSEGIALAQSYDAITADYIDVLNTWIMAMDPVLFEAMANADAVEWIDVIPPPLTEVNDLARQVVGANTIQAAPYNLSGSGVTVCVYDGGLVDGTHTDFGGRVTAGEGGSIANHATHVAGSVGGSGALSSGQYRGMAPGCDIVSYLYESCSPYCLYNSPQDIADNYQEAIDTYGAELATNSIGANVVPNGYSCSWLGDYELTSQLVDNIVRGSLGSPFIVLFAAGNERNSPATCGTTYNTMSIPAGAKNIITVGATNDTDGMSSFSSWGPTDDGRIKPEVCAPGVSIHSTLPGNTYGDMSGTSMATPITAGCVADILQQFHISFPGLAPLPSTIKALLINTAEDLGNVGPDYTYGFGRVDVQAAVDAVMGGGFLEDQLTTGQTQTYTFTVAAGTPLLRTSLSWMDPAATPLANPTLINDLDLTLTSPSSTVYYPYTLNSASPSTPATTGMDHTNNSEQVVIASPESGQWTITVSATSLPSGPQSFSLACSNSILAGYGTLAGTVRDASNNPLTGVQVQNTSGPQSVTTDASGLYSMAVPVGTHSIEYSKFAYITQTIPGIAITNGNITTQNVVLQSAPTGMVSGTVTSCNGGPAVGATVEVMNVPVSPATTNASGYYSITLPQGTYTIRAFGAGCGEQVVSNVVIGATATQDFTLPSDPRYMCSPEDAYGYTACENVDPDGPVYAWRAIAPSEGGSGTVVTLTDDSYSGPTALPFPVKFYGTTYTNYYIGSNGFVTFSGGYSVTSGCVPDGTAPVGIYAMWNDLNPATGGQVATYYDAANHLLVIEFYQINHYGTTTAETFEIVIYDPAYYPTATGDANIVLQYNVAASVASCGVGIQGSSANYLNYLCSGTLPENSTGLAAGRAIRFSTGDPCAGDADISLSAASITGTAPLNGTDVDSIQICNLGPCPLYWSTVWNQSTPVLVTLEPTVVSVTKEEAASAPKLPTDDKNSQMDAERGDRNELDSYGGPDSYGYNWVDSNEPDGPVYNWVELASVGTALNFTSDDQIIGVTLPFSFPFYGSTYTEARISANGNIHFSADTVDYGNRSIPHGRLPNAMLAALWDDLSPQLSGAHVWTYYDAANSRYIVQFDSVNHYSSTTGNYTFEILMYSDGRIVYQYQQLSGTLTSCSVGIENETGTVGLQAVYNAAYLTNNLAIQFSARPIWLSLGTPTDGTLNSGECQYLRLDFSAQSLAAGSYTGNLVFSSNDPDENPTLIPVTFMVGQLNPPTDLTINYIPETDQLQFNWVGSGASLYKLYSSTTPDGPFTTLVGQTSDTTLSIANPRDVCLFYVVVSSD